MQRRTFLKACAAGVAAGLAGPRAEAQEEAKAMVPFALVDTHVHFWDPEHLSYDWIKGSEILNRAYLPADHTAAAKPYEVEKIVFVEAAVAPDQVEDEVAWVSQLAQEDRRIQGIVAAAPLEQGEGVMPMLERMASSPLVKGIRRLIQTERDPEWCLQPGFVAGVQALEKVGLSFDIGARRDQLSDVTELVRRCPNVRFALNHVGFPNIAGGQLDPWRQHIRDLAALPNVICKMSGVATAAKRDAWTKEDVRPYIDHVIASFGVERVAFGSDWPVMLLATPYPRWVETLAWAVEAMSEDEKRQVFRETGSAFYRV